MLTVLSILSICGIMGVTGAAEPAHPFGVENLVAVERISDPQVSPDGVWVVFAVARADMEANRFRSDLWVVRPDGTDLRRLTTHVEDDTNPRWMPDGRTICFLSSRTGTSQVWKIDVGGGEAQPVTNLPLDLGNLVVSGDGRHIAFSADVFADCKTMAETKSRLEENEKRKASGRIYEKLFVRHWDTWKDGRRSHVFVMPISGGEAVDVMAGMDVDWPPKPFAGADQLVFTLDGGSVVFSVRDVASREAWSTDFDLYVAPVDGSSSRRCLTEQNEAWDGSPAFSPDGRTLAYLAMSRAGYESDRFRIVLRGWPEGLTRVLADGWDRSPSRIFWDASGEEIFAIAEDVGRRALFAVDVRTGRVRTVVKGGCVDDAAVGGERLVFTHSSLKSPSEVHSMRLDGTGLRAITDLNRQRLESALMGEYEQFSFAGWNDETVYAYIVKPVGFDPDRKYPVSFWIHGGPQGTFGDSFHYRWNPQIHAGAGYAVLMVDFHGSTGYGQAFCDSIRGDWGGKPLEDLRKGLAAALKRYPWLDGSRAGALGASFGGYMVNWIAGNWADGFKCLVSHAGNLDERLAYFDTEELWFPEWDHVGTPWENPQSYERQNPINYVQNWRTPMLVTHGGRDFRVVETQGLSVFTALQRRGIPSKLLYFPDESHFVAKPHNMIQWQETVLAWLDQWLK